MLCYAVYIMQMPKKLSMKSSLVLRLSLLAASVLVCGFPFVNTLQLNVYTHSQASVKLIYSYL